MPRAAAVTRPTRKPVKDPARSPPRSRPARAASRRPRRPRQHNRHQQLSMLARVVHDLHRPNGDTGPGQLDDARRDRGRRGVQSRTSTERAYPAVDNSPSAAPPPAARCRCRADRAGHDEHAKDQRSDRAPATAVAPTRPPPGADEAGGGLAHRAGTGDRPDHLALILRGCRVRRGSAGGEEVYPTRWTTDGGVPTCCAATSRMGSTERCLWPLEPAARRCGPGRLLHGNRPPGPASDPVAELRKTDGLHGWLDKGRAADAPEAQRWMACECLLPYRETTELLTELVRQSERFGEDAPRPAALAGRTAAAVAAGPGSRGGWRTRTCSTSTRGGGTG